MLNSPEPSAKPVATAAQWPMIAGVSLAFALILYLTLGLTFRFSGYGEGLYDLHYVAGGWLNAGWPTPELWRPNSVVTHYYNLGLAGWGRVGSWFGLSLGSTYVLGLLLFPTLVFGLVLAMAAGSWALRSLVALVATFPASGISLWLGLGFVELPGHLQNMGHVRLLEWADRAGEDALAQALISGKAYPLESLAHLVLELQNMHPPVMGFALLAAVLFWYLGPSSRADQGLLTVRQNIRAGLFPGGLLVLAYAVNAWMVPMLFGTVLGMLLLRRDAGGALGAALGAALAYAVLWWPFFRYFEAPDAVAVTWLDAAHRSRPLSWLLVWLPCLLATFWWLLSTSWKRRQDSTLRMAERLFPLLFLGAVLSLEFIHLDDGYGGDFERFNSVLKTGSLALAAWITSLLVLATRQKRVGVWLPILILLALPSFLQLKDLGARILRDSQHSNWALQEPAMIDAEDLRQTYLALREEIPGITLEFTTSTAYNIVPLVSTLAGFPTWSGWASHLGQVGAFSAQDWKIREQLLGWYQQFPPDNSVLDQHAVDYVLVRYALKWDQQTIDERRNNLGPAWEWAAAVSDARGYQAGYFRRVLPAR